jgi:hypothetical protein
MTRLRLSSTLGCLALAISGISAASALAAGAPGPGIDISSQGLDDGAGNRVHALPGRDGTVLARIRRGDAVLIGSTTLRGSFGVPAVASDGSTAGLSRDGRTLTLVRPRASFLQKKTVLALLDARRLRLRKLIRLRGDFGFDAISPDGRFLYLVQYLSKRDPTRYLVRAFDVRAGHLTREPIIDPREPDEKMRGYPITRATSTDGRWAYTLYDGAGKHPFVHALDTTRQTAACIDLDALAGRKDLFALRLRLGSGGDELAIVRRGVPVLAIDTRTFRVDESPATAAGGGEGTAALVLGLAAGMALAAVAVLVVAIRRRRRVARAQPV